MKQSNLYINASGGGPTTVFLPGMLGSTLYWQYLTKVLNDQGRSVVNLDLLGYGKSPKPRGSQYDVNAHCMAIESALSTVQLTKPVAIAGISMSTILASELVRRNPGMFDKLVLFSPMIYSSPQVAKKLSYVTGNIPSCIAHGPIAWGICHTLCKVKPVAKVVYRLFNNQGLSKEVIEDGVYHSWRSYARTFKHVIVQQGVGEYLKTVPIDTHFIYGKNDVSTELDFLKLLQQQNKNIHLHESGSKHHAAIHQPALALGVLL